MLITRIPLPPGYFT